MTEKVTPFFVSACCTGETCNCGQPAQRKIEETIFFDDPNPVRHPMTNYLCLECFLKIMKRGHNEFDKALEEFE